MLEELLKRLNSRNDRVREEAIAEAKALPPEQLLELAEKEKVQYREHKRSAYWFAGIFGTLALAGILALMIANHFKGGGFWVQLWRIIPLIFFLALPRRGRQSVANLLEQTEDARLIGPALDILRDNGNSAEIMESARKAIKNLLPLLTLEQARNLTLEQRQALLIPLSNPLADKELTLRILKILEQVGDTSAIPVVEQLTTYTNQTSVWKRDVRYLFRKTADEGAEIRAAAEECLPYLRISAERIEQQQTLLRASDAIFFAPAEVLLRPAHPTENTTPAKELLRPTSGTPEPQGMHEPYTYTPVKEVEQPLTVGQKE